MHDIIKFLKDAVTRSDLPGVNGCFIVENNTVYAYNKLAGLQAGVVMESGASFAVPAEAFERALSRIADIQSLKIKDDVLTVKGGRISNSIKLNSDPAPGIPDMPKKWKKIPSTFLQALALARPFINKDATNATTCIRIMDDRVTAVNGQSLIDIEVKGLEVEPCCLKDEIVGFLVGQDIPSHCAATDRAITFKWEDGRWARAQLYEGSFPEENIETIFNNAGTEVPVTITAEFREAYADASALTSDAVMITAKGFKAMALSGGAEVAVAEASCIIKGLPDDHASYWTCDKVGPVFAIAEKFNPLTWPNPCYWEAPGVRGVVMGRRTW